MTTTNDIRNWLLEGQQQKATHCIIVCDTFDYEDYPVYVTKRQDVHEIEKRYSGVNMQQVMEIYNLKKSLDSQLNQRFCFNY